jgi:hypothetical protein
MLIIEMRRLLILIESNQHDDIPDREIDDDELENGNAPGYTYYHGTTLAVWQDHIQHEGLDPIHSAWEDDEKDNFPDIEGPHHFIYMSGPSYAEEWARDTRGEEPCVVLRIRPTPEIERQFIFDRGEFIRSPVKIPPQCISVYRTYD